MKEGLIIFSLLYATTVLSMNELYKKSERCMPITVKNFFSEPIYYAISINNHITGRGLIGTRSKTSNTPNNRKIILCKTITGWEKLFISKRYSDFVYELSEKELSVWANIRYQPGDDDCFQAEIICDENGKMTLIEDFDICHGQINA